MELMSDPKSARKIESVRLAPTELEWLDAWCKSTGQNRSLVMRAAIRAYSMMLSDAPVDRCMVITSELGDESEFAPLWALATLLRCAGKLRNRIECARPALGENKKISVRALAKLLATEQFGWGVSNEERKEDKHWLDGLDSTGADSIESQP